MYCGIRPFGEIVEYSGTPVTRPIMGPRSDGQWSWKSEGEFHDYIFPPKKMRTVESLACMHDWGDSRSPFHDKNSYFLEKDYSNVQV
jgi:hypothetical protein